MGNWWDRDLPDQSAGGNWWERDLPGHAPEMPVDPADPLPALGMPPVAPLLNTQPVPALPADQPLSAAFGPLATAPAASPVDPELAATAAARFIYANPDANRHVEQRLAELMAPPVPDPAPQEPLSELLKRRGQQFVTGAAETVASVPEGVAVAKANADRAMQDHVSDQIGEQARQAKSYRDILDAGVSPMNGGPMTPQERAVYEQRYQEAALGMKNWVERIETEVKDADARGEFAAAQAIRDAVAGVVGVPDPSDESFWGKVFTGAGTTLPYLATALTGPLAIPAGGALGAAQGSAGQYKDAKQAGASEEDAIRAARLGGAVGTTEIIPIDRALNLLPPRVRQAVTSKIGKLVGDVAQGAGEEAVQEAGSQALNNLIAAGIYDPDRGWSEGVSESAIIGAILGGALGGAGSIIRGSEKDAAQPTPPEPEEEPDGGNERVAGQENPQVDAGLRNVEQEGREGDAPVPDGGRADSAEQQGIGNTQGRVADAGRTDEQPEHLNGAEPAPTEPAPADAAPVANPERRDTIYTPDNDPVDVEYRVVEADEVLTSDQQGYDQSAQPRNRAKNKNSEVQIEGIANNPIFRRLNRAPETDRGAPVIGQDGLVESGNGRVIGLRRAYERGTAEEYRKALEAEYPEAKGMRAPIVVASRLTDMNRTDFAYRSNKPATQAMSAVEEARAEARMFDRDVLDLYRGGELTSVANRPMLMAFIKRLPQADQNRLITPEGGLTADGARRVQAAMFYRAFEDHKLLSRMAESVDDDMRGISGVLTKMAPRVAQMRDEMERGKIAKEGDFIPALVEAIGQIANFRARGEDLKTFNTQADAFSEPLSEDVQDIMAAMFNPAGTRLASKAAVEKFIEKAVEGAMKQDTSTSDLPGVEAVPPKSSVEIVKNARKAAETDEDQTAFFDGSPDTRKGDGRGRAGGKRTADGGSRKADAGDDLIFSGVHDDVEGPILSDEEIGSLIGSLREDSSAEKMATVGRILQEQRWHKFGSPEYRKQSALASIALIPGIEKWLPHSGRRAEGELYVSPDVPAWANAMVAGLRREFGIENEQLDLITFEHAKASAESDKRGWSGISRDAGKASTLAMMTYSKGRWALAVRKNSLKNIENVENLAHEFGHLIQHKMFDALPKRKQAAILAEFGKFASKPRESLAGKRFSRQPARTGRAEARRVGYSSRADAAREIKGGNARYDAGFDEWFADQVAKNLSTSSTVIDSIRPFFGKVAQMWRKIAAWLRANGYTNKAVDQFLNDIRVSRSVSAVKSRGRKADAGTLQDARVGRRPPGKLSPTFTEFSYTSRPSVYSHAFRQAGIDPKDGRMMPVEDQLPIVAKAIEDRFGIKVELPTTTVVKKNLAGRKVAKDVPSLQLRKALDQLLNAYRQMQMLAHVMAVPEKAIGLPIDGKPLTLSLVSTNRLRGALGMFSYGNGKRTISIPDMSNSFAHEWGHALDHYLGHMADRPFLKGMLTRKMNKDGVIPPLSPRRAITDAFAHVLWSMYGGSNAMGHLILDLQVDSAQLGPDGKPTQKAQVARKVLTDIREGRTPPRQYWSVYFRSAAAYDAMVEGGGYFTDPAEMFARAFEAFVGKQVAAISDQPQAFLSKGEWAYSDMTDQRAAMTFPKGLDLDQFTLAMVNLQHAMSRINLHGPDAPASAPETHDVLSTKDLLKSMPDTLTAAEKREWARTLDIMADLPAITKDKARAVAVGLDTFHSQAIRTGAATMFAIADRQKNPAARQAFTSIAEAVGKRPGRGKLVTSVWEETVRRKANARMNKLDGAVRKYGKRLTKAKLNELKAALTDPDATVSDPAIKELAVDIRLVMDEIWYDLQDAGINVGYKSNYLPHVYDPDRATADPDGFRDAAAKVYDLMFQREIVENDDTEAQIADMNSIINGLRKATVAMPKDDRAPSPRITEDQEATIAAWRAARSKLTRLNKQLEKTDDPDAVQEKIAAQQEVVEELHGEILDFLKDAWAKYSAENWMVRMRVGELNDFGSIGPEGNFLKGRTLPNEAGVIMRKFMFDNPMEMLTEYAFAAAKKAEYARVFGADNSKLQNMLDAAEGASREDVEMMKRGVQAATGRVQGSGGGWQSFKTTVFSLGNVNLLPFAAWSSLAEPLSAGLRTGYARDSVKALAGFVVPLVRRKRYRDLKEISRAIGLVTPYTLDTLMENRLGADVIGKHWLQTVVSRSFIVNGLTPLTHYQRTAMMPVANAALLRHLRAYVEGKRGIYGAMRDVIDGKQKSFANGELNELGIAEADRADLLKWMDSVGGMPHFDDLYGPDGQFHKAAELWSRAVYRMTTEIIQDPLKTDRQILANNPDHAAMYGIMSFMAAFTRNIIWRNIERGIKDTDSKGKVAAKVSLNIAAAALPFATLYMGQFLVGMLRDGLFYSDKLDEMEDDEAIEWLALRALDRTGVYGQLSPLVNLVNGVRYETDMTSLFTGPYLAHFAKNTQEVIAAFIGRNSENTNTAEHKAARAMYRQLVKPVALSLIAGVAPTGPVSGNVARAAYFALASRNTETDFADALAGERGAKHVGPPPWWEVGD